MRYPAGRRLVPGQRVVVVAACTAVTVACAGGTTALATAAPSVATAGHYGGRAAAQAAGTPGNILILTVVPRLQGLSVNQARQALTLAGLVLALVNGAVDCSHLGTVSGQTPAADATALYGSSVAVTVGVKPKPPRVCP